MRILPNLLAVGLAVMVLCPGAGAKDLDPCSLLLEQDAVDLLKKPVQVAPQRTGALPSCDYKVSLIEHVTLTLYGTTQTFAQRVEWAEKNWKATAEPVPGIGDRAARVSRQLFVEKKGVIFAVTIVHRMPDEEMIPELIALAKKAAGRLP